MNSKQRRAVKRQLPAAGTRVLVRQYSDGPFYVGVVSASRFMCPTTRVRVEYDNGTYRTWNYERVDSLQVYTA